MGYGHPMRNRLGMLLVAGVTLGSVLMAPVGGGVATAAPTPSPASSPTASGVAPLDHGWVATIDDIEFDLPPVVPVPTLDSGSTGVGGAPTSNVLTGSMTGKHGTYKVQVALPVGQTFIMGRSYTSYNDSASLQVTWPGGGCESDAGSGEASFTVNQLVSAGGAATAYAVQFLCYSPVSLVEGAIAFNVVPTAVGQGYYTFGSDGSINGFGNDSYLNYLGSLATTQLNQPIVGMAITPDGRGYWLVGADGGVFAFGDATFYGSMGATVLNQPIVGMSATSDGRGYWMVAADGGIFAFGDAVFHGSMGGKPLNEPIVGMSSSPDGGYRLVASDGGIFSFGATFYGSMGGRPLNEPIVGMTSTHDGKGYWMVASDGGIFSFGDAGYYGSTGAIPLNQPIVGMVATSDGAGYWMAASDGGVFAFGDAPFFGSLGGLDYFDVAGIAN